MIRCLALFALLLCLAATQPVRAQDLPPPTGDATAFLRWSMARHAALKTFQAEGTWALEFAGLPKHEPEAHRVVTYAAPDRFRVTSTMHKRLVHDYISDGKRFVVVLTGYNQPPQRYPAPARFAEIVTPGVGPAWHPHFGGSALYRFFSGPDGLPLLLQKEGTGRPVTFGPDVTLDGEPCKTIAFTCDYGDTRAAVSLRDGMVRRLEYFAPEQKRGPEEIAASQKAIRNILNSAQGKKFSPEQRAGMQKMMNTPAASIPASTTTEIYTRIIVNQPIPDATFDTTLPGGAKFAEVGQTVPDGVAVTPLAGGRPVPLSDLRGQVVLIDFWATWCPPCRKGLPETLALHREFKNKGLKVLAVTDEDAKTVGGFVKTNKYGALPVYRDTGGAAARAFGVNAIPTVAIIGRDGKLAAQFVGLQTPQTLRAALKKAGL